MRDDFRWMHKVMSDHRVWMTKQIPYIADEDADLWTEDVILSDGTEVIAINIEYAKLDEWWRTMTDRVVIYVETHED